eukprot:4739657-Prymnesium_polylepis.1
MSTRGADASKLTPVRAYAAARRLSIVVLSCEARMAHFRAYHALMQAYTLFLHSGLVMDGDLP